MTSSDSVNLISCEIAKYKYKLENVVSVVNSKENLLYLMHMESLNYFFKEGQCCNLIINSSGITLPISLLI